MADTRPTLVSLDALSRSARSLSMTASSRSLDEASPVVGTERPARRLPARSGSMKINRPRTNSMGTAESSEQQAVASPGKTANFRRQLPRRANSQRFERNRVELSDDDAEMESDESQQ